jgi:hypothetical protein
MKKRSGSKMVGVADGEKEAGDGKGVKKDKGARQDPAVALLTMRLEELERQLETERKLNHLEIEEVTAKNHEDLLELERQLEESVKKREEMNERLDRVETMEKSIANLYLEVHDRTSTDKRSQEEIEEERVQLRKKNPLVVLDQLRAHLRSLLAFRDDYENELKSHVQKKRTETEEGLFKAKQELEERVWRSVFVTIDQSQFMTLNVHMTDSSLLCWSVGRCLFVCGVNLFRGWKSWNCKKRFGKARAHETRFKRSETNLRIHQRR